MTSRFAANRTSLLILKVFTRCGFKPLACQIRRTVVSLSPVAAAMVRVLQCVALKGFSCVVLRITSAVRVSLIARGLLWCDPQFRCDLLILLTGGGSQHNSRPFHQTRRQTTSARDPLQRSLFLLIQHHWSGNTHANRPSNCKDDPQLIFVTIYGALH